MTTSEQLEREAEQTRGQIIDTLAELRDRLTPGRMMDEALDYVRDGNATQYMRNLGRQIVQHPIPTALVGVGIAWLMMAGNSHRSNYRRTGLRHKATSMTQDISDSASHAAENAGTAMREASDTASHGYQNLAEQTWETASAFGDQTREAGSRLQDTARSAMETASSTYEQTRHSYSKAASAARNSASAIGQSASIIAENTVSSGRTFLSYLRDEPLALAGIGLALGALIGASLPESETENRLMGESREALKEDAMETANQQWEKGKEAVEKGWQTVKEEVKQDFTPENESERKEETTISPSIAAEADVNQIHMQSETQTDRTKPASASHSLRE